MRLLTLILLLLTAGSANAIEADQCWTLGGCPGPAPSISDATPNFSTHLDTDGSAPIGLCGVAWSVNYDSSLVQYQSAQRAQGFNPEFDVNCFSNPTSGTSQCLQCDRNLICVYEDRFENAFPLIVSGSQAEVRVNWQWVSPDPALIIFDGIDAGEFVWDNGSCGLLIDTDVIGNLSTVPEPQLAAGLFPALLLLFLLASPARASGPGPMDVNGDGKFTDADDVTFLQAYAVCMEDGDGAPSCAVADVNLDGLVDIDDVNTFGAWVEERDG